MGMCLHVISLLNKNETFFFKCCYYNLYAGNVAGPDRYIPDMVIKKEAGKFFVSEIQHQLVPA